MIDTWSEPQRPDYAKVLREREEAQERGRQRRQREQEALEWQRQQKTAKERADLWAWYENEYDVAESFAARDRAREVEAARMVSEQIKTEVLITEVENAVHERYADGQNPCDTYVVARS